MIKRDLAGSSGQSQLCVNRNVFEDVPNRWSETAPSDSHGQYLHDLHSVYQRPLAYGSYDRNGKAQYRTPDRVNGKQVKKKMLSAEMRARRSKKNISDLKQQVNIYLELSAPSLWSLSIAQRDALSSLLGELRAVRELVVNCPGNMFRAKLASIDKSIDGAKRLLSHEPVPSGALSVQLLWDCSTDQGLGDPYGSDRVQENALPSRVTSVVDSERQAFIGVTFRSLNVAPLVCRLNAAHARLKKVVPLPQRRDRQEMPAMPRSNAA